MLEQEQQLQQLILDVKKAVNHSNKKAKIVQFLQPKLASLHHGQCLLIHKILGSPEVEADETLPALTPQQLCDFIASCLKQVNSLSIFVTLYSAWDRCRKACHTDINWRDEYQKKRSKGLLNQFNGWLQTTSLTDSGLVNQTLFRVMGILPSFLGLEKIRLTYFEFDSCLLWLSMFAIRTRDDYLCARRTAQLIKEVTDVRTKDYEKKQHLILRRIIELLGQQERKNNSLYLFFDRFTIRTQDIEYFINIEECFFEDLDEKHLCNVFSALIQPGINKQILSFFRKVSGLLKSNEQFYILRTLFEQLVLPIVAAKYKAHIKLGDEIFQFVLFYTAGFLSHCFIGEEGVRCLLQGVELIQKQAFRQMWGELAILCCKDDDSLKNKALKQLQKAGLSNISTSKLMNFIAKEDMIWTVTMHNGRKLKKYPEIESHRYKGIQNLNNQCYIISVVQALYTTEETRNITNLVKSQFKPKNLKVLEELRYIFESDLNIQTKDNKATVKYLKNVGHEDFRLSERQEDAQEYIGKLFQCLEAQLKKTNRLKDFQETFLSEYSVKICCKDCKVERELKQHQFHYINTYGTKENFELIRQQPLDQNYKCEKCSSKKCVKITTMINRPKILILHINRFRQKEGELKKILGNHPIKRTIDIYQLVGFVAHKGEHIHAGHYQYYCRIDQNRWALFNDIKVTEFNVAEDQEFERQFRAENTPYLLFYRQKKYLK